MTDAAMPVTERAVEQFTESYLTALGADIRKDGRRWTVSLPDSADTDLELDGTVLQIATDPEAVDDDAVAVAPDSSFVERMFDEAADRDPLGSLTLTGESWEIAVPPWITAGPVDVVDRAFTPYYDRRALCALFHVGIETVSEYQREELHATALDFNGHDARPALAETYLELTGTDRQRLRSEDISVDTAALREAIHSAQDDIEDEITPTVRETRERATRAAEVELDEYRQFVRQRRDEVREEIDRLEERIEEVNATIDETSKQNERVDALRERKQLRSELDDLRSELDDLTSQIEANFPEKREEIRDRHALTVRIRPVAATSVSYERGDLELTLRAGEVSSSVSYAYAVGSGVMDDPDCERCGRELTAENPLALDGTRRVGLACCGAE